MPGSVSSQRAQRAYDGYNGHSWIGFELPKSRVRCLLVSLLTSIGSVVNSSIHPDTGKPVPLPFRMSAFVPTNLM
jgi:hypothetical protein